MTRAVEPANIRFTESSQVKVFDSGLAEALDRGDLNQMYEVSPGRSAIPDDPE